MTPFEIAVGVFAGWMLRDIARAAILGFVAARRQEFRGVEFLKEWPRCAVGYL